MARSKWVDLALVVAIVPLGVWAWRTGRERAVMEDKFAKYTRKAGELGVGDRSKTLLRKLETDEPFHFAWRMFLPAGAYDQVGVGEASRDFQSLGTESIVYRCRIGEDQGRLRVSLNNHGPGGGSGIQTPCGPPALAEFLRGRWDRIIVEQTAATELVAADPSKPLVLLRLKLPAELEAEAREKLAGSSEIRLPIIFELTLESKGPNP